MPFAESTFLSAFEFPAREPGGKLADARALEYVVTPGFGEALGVRVREGRLFTDAVSFAAAPTLVLTVAFAACLVPAVRTASADPVEGLRSE
jgi:hypothetical protein